MRQRISREADKVATGRRAQGRRVLALALSAAALAGCEVGPDYTTPAAPHVAGVLPGALQTGDGQQRFVAGADIPAQWWATFHSRPLNALIERALQQNADLQAARAALRAARENGTATRGALYPQVTTEFNSTGGRVSAIESSPLSNNSQYYSLTTPQLNISYTPDVFGLTRRNIESADALARNQRFQVEATYLTLTSNLVAAAIQEASLRAQIEATHHVIKIETDLLAILHRQLGAGQVAMADVLVQEAALAQAQQSLPPLEKQLGVNRDLLTALAGQYSVDEVKEKFELGSLHLPHDLPVSLPSRLVEHRPDVRAAEANLQSASALIGVAAANRLPLISLSAQVGTSADNLAYLFSPPNAFYTLAANVTHTVFDGGTLLHRQKQAEADFDQSYAQYRGAVIGAFQNVADSLRALQTDTRAVKTANAAETAARKSLDIARKQLGFGQVSNIIVLTAEQTYMQAVLSRIQAEAGRYTDTAALFQALGGGWWNRVDDLDGKR